MEISKPIHNESYKHEWKLCINEFDDNEYDKISNSCNCRNLMAKISAVPSDA